MGTSIGFRSPTLTHCLVPPYCQRFQAHLLHRPWPRGDVDPPGSCADHCGSSRSGSTRPRRRAARLIPVGRQADVAPGVVDPEQGHVVGHAHALLRSSCLPHLAEGSRTCIAGGLASGSGRSAGAGRPRCAPAARHWRRGSWARRRSPRDKPSETQRARAARGCARPAGIELLHAARRCGCSPSGHRCRRQPTRGGHQRLVAVPLTTQPPRPAGRSWQLDQRRPSPHMASQMKLPRRLGSARRRARRTAVVAAELLLAQPVQRGPRRSRRCAGVATTQARPARAMPAGT